MHTRCKQVEQLIILTDTLFHLRPGKKTAEVELSTTNAAAQEESKTAAHIRYNLRKRKANVSVSLRRQTIKHTEDEFVNFPDCPWPAITFVTCYLMELLG